MIPVSSKAMIRSFGLEGAQGKFSAKLIPRDEARKILAPGGALETFVKARDEGLILHIGFSAHSEDAALLMLDSFEFDSVLFPINFSCWNEGGFGPKLIEKALEQQNWLLQS